MTLVDFNCAYKDHSGCCFHLQIGGGGGGLVKVSGINLSNDPGKTESNFFCHSAIRSPLIGMFSFSHKECINLQKRRF